jgi:hypothetical protein
MILIAALAATWLFVVGLSMALMRSAAPADRDAEHWRHEAAPRRARTAAMAVAVAVPIVATAASDASARSAATTCQGAGPAPQAAGEAALARRHCGSGSAPVVLRPRKALS